MTLVDKNFIRSSHINNMVLDIGQFGIRNLWAKLHFGLTRVNST